VHGAGVREGQILGAVVIGYLVGPKEELAAQSEPSLATAAVSRVFSSANTAGVM